MRNRARRVQRFVLLGLVVTTGVLFTTGAGPACASFGIDTAQTTVNFCFLFDCQSGAFGGLIQFCDQEHPENYFFADCEQLDTDTP